MVYFTTGVGTEILYKTADKLGLADEFLSSLQAANIAARGYKTVNMLKSSVLLQPFEMMMEVQRA